MNILKVSETNLARYEFEDSILTIKLTDGLVVDTPIMKQLLLEAVNFTKNQKYFAIIDLTNNIESTFESRNFYAENELNKFRLADAFIVNSLYLQSLTNFYLKFKKPIIPSKMFNDLESAKKMDILIERVNSDSLINFQ
jgi:hypothetical protein